MQISANYDPASDAILFFGDNLELCAGIPNGSVDLIVTSPPYNVGKSYEERLTIDEYLARQQRIIDTTVPLMTEQGSICWQVGNHLPRPGMIIPLDIMLFDMFAKHGLVLRNRIIWQFGHGLHASKRFSGRYETIMWFTKDTDYYFDLNAVRVPQKYPGKKHYKGPKHGEYSGHPLGKNPTDVWDIPNVKANHVEKTGHPCQFPIALIQRLVRALTPSGGWVFDPYMGVGSSACAALLEGRRAIGAETDEGYFAIAMKRVEAASRGELRIRPLEKDVYIPDPRSPLTRRDDLQNELQL